MFAALTRWRTQAPTSFRLATVALFTVAVIAISFFLSPLSNSYLSSGAAMAIVLLGLSFLTGWSGQVSIGNSAFMAVGGYSAAIWAHHHTTTPISGRSWCHGAWRPVGPDLGPSGHPPPGPLPRPA
jgi:ABC-type branched-subunit amino acid transport system permease subunit